MIQLDLTDADARVLLRLVEGRVTRQRLVSPLVLVTWEARLAEALKCALAECGCGDRR
jgi:hypothetical protein